jgi:hypothetical protein
MKQNWIVYDNEHYSAKELTVFPGYSVRIKDTEAYGFILVQGRGTIEGNEMESPNMIRFGELTSDEFFVTKARANDGALIVNTSRTENLVMLKHFGPPA